jgi:hypothetical protein
MLSPVLLELLNPRHKDKVALALRSDVMRGTVRRGVLSGASYADETVLLFAALPAEHREPLIAGLVRKLGGGWESQAYATRLVCALSDQLSDDEASRLAAALASALLHDNPFDASAELNRAFDDLGATFKGKLHHQLRSQYGTHAPGAPIARHVLQRMGTAVPEHSA